jgi:carbon-monoxide dehydrogenase medium subunit
MFDHVQAFHRPSTVPEAVRLLRRAGRGGRFVAGATDVTVQADRSIRALVDITQLGLNYIRRNGGTWRIGATTTFAEIENSPALRSLANGIVSTAAAACGSVQNRNLATLGGNLGNASPAADTVPPLLVLDAVVVLAAARGRRRIPLSEFFVGPHKTVANGALITEIEIPAPPRGGRMGFSFQKLRRVEPDISLVSVAAGLQLDRQGRCQRARLALGAVGPTPLRALKAESVLVAEKLSDTVLGRACDEVARAVQPITDVRASAEYRREMSRVLARRALRECVERGVGN